MNCEERYGQQQVEWLLDAAYALMHQGVHRYPHAKVRDLKAEAEREAERRAHRERVYNDLWRTLPIEPKHEPSQEDDRRPVLNLPQDNRSEEHTPELQSLIRHTYAVFCSKNQ